MTIPTWLVTAVRIAVRLTHMDSVVGHPPWRPGLALLLGTLPGLVGFSSSLVSGSQHPYTVTRPSIHVYRLPDPYERTDSVFDNTVAWDGEIHNFAQPDRVYVANLDHFQPLLVALSLPYTYLADVHLSARWLAWLDLRSGPVGRWWIWAQDRHTGSRYLVDSSAREGRTPLGLELYATYEALWGDTAMWTFTTCGVPCRATWTSSVYLMKLPNGLRREVLSVRYPCNLTWPSISAQVAVWDREGVCEGRSGTDVMLLDRASGHVRLLTRNYQASESVTNGQYVAWKEARSRLDDGAIVLMNLRTGTRRVLMNVNSTTPEMSDNAVAWLREDLGSLYAFDMKTKRRYTLVRPSGPNSLSPGELGTGSGTKLIWEEDKLHRDGYTITRYLAVADMP